MDTPRAVSEFLSLSGDLFRLLRSGGQSLSTVELQTLRTQLHILQVEITSLEIENSRNVWSAASARLADEPRKRSIAYHHAVEFYKDDWFLMESVSAFIKVGLDVHDAVMVMATAAHREALAKALRPDEWANEGLSFFDAEELLARVMVNDWPDESQFMGVLSAILLPARQMGRVRVFGELSAVLWAEGKSGAAVRLEELWNTLAMRHQFSLVCAYPQSGFSGDEGRQAQFDICQSHRHVHIQ